MNFNILNESFKLITNNNEIIDFFKKRLISTSQETNNYIKILENIIEMKYKNKILSINGTFNSSDLYQVYNNYLSMIINNNNSCYVHSVVISKNNEGILLIGTFGQGKTTFSENAVKYGFEINSSDHTILSIINKKLYMIEGSSYVKYNNDNYNISYEYTHKKIEINKIVFLYGLAINGELNVKNVLKKHFEKQLYQYCSWHFNLPIKTNIEKTLYNSNKSILPFLTKVNKLNIPAFIVRGDNDNIIKYFLDIK